MVLLVVVNTITANNYVMKDPGKWRQPMAVHGHYPKIISTQNWRFDFSNTEQILSRVKLDKDDELIIDELTLGILTRALGSLPVHINKNQLARVGFLIDKGLPAPGGLQLKKLMLDFFAYKLAIEGHEYRNDLNLGLLESIANLQKSRMLQQHYFCKDTANKLFKRQHDMAQYLFDRREIQGDSQLSLPEKQQRLLNLQYTFKHHSTLFMQATALK